MDSSGNFVVVWSRPNGSPFPVACLAQRFNASGVPLGTEFQVNTTVPSSVENSNIAMDSAGNFVVVWDNNYPPNLTDIRGQRFSALGEPQGPEFVVAPLMPNANFWAGWGSKVAVDPVGNFVVTWQASVVGTTLWDIYARRYDANGQTLGEPFCVNTQLDGFQLSPDIAITHSGGFVITWNHEFVGAKARYYSPTGEPQSGEILVGSGTYLHTRPAIAVDSLGTSTIAYNKEPPGMPGQDDVYARRLDSLGVPLGNEFLVNSTTAGGQEWADVAASSDGRFVITWHGPGLSPFDFFAQAYNGAGQPIGGEFLVNTPTGDFEGAGAIAMNPAGDFVVTWTTVDSANTFRAILARRYRPGVPQVQSTRINDGLAQRSRVTSLTVTFDTIVNFESTVADAFTLIRNGGKPVTFKATASNATGVTVVTLNDFIGSSTQFGSLADGRYTLTALASHITDNLGQALDGDGNGQAGGNHTFGDAQGLFRMFGDVNGDRQVDGADFGAFSSTFNLNSSHPNFLWFMDINGDGQVDGFDFGHFSGRYNTILP
jgi:hypothetical protein